MNGLAKTAVIACLVALLVLLVGIAKGAEANGGDEMGVLVAGAGMLVIVAAFVTHAKHRK